jgi:iron(II)-dependent oxidoreductase
VVGVCWHEAQAFARWVGKRLPSDAEWVKAGSWPVPVAQNNRLQRKYPWGDMFVPKCANTWHAGVGRTVPVSQFADGVSVGGVHQLIGNVWEWTSSNMRAEDQPGNTLTFDVPTKSLRGGAFDTYFENQATCHFQSGDGMLARKPNIGFRCAVGVGDLILGQAGQAGGSETGQAADQAEEVPA